MQSPKKRRTLGIILSAALIAAIALTGTFALILPNQHASNLFSGSGADANNPSVKLVDTFSKPVANWQVGRTNKNVSVLNDGSVPVFVKMKFKEYMDITAKIGLFKYWKVTENPAAPAIVSADENPSLFAIKDDPTKGDVFVVMPGDGSENAADVIAYFQGLGYVANKVAYFTEAINNQTGWFVVTEKGDKNGQYGRYAYAATGEGAAGTKTVLGTKPFANCYHYDKHDSDHECKECEYDVRKWDAAGGLDATSLAFMEYVSWILGDDVIFMADWLVGGTTFGGDTVAAKAAGAYWIIDTDGSIYWGQALQSGIETSKFMEQVELLKLPNGDFNYIIHIDMDASTDPRTDWTHPGSNIPSDVNRDVLDAWQPPEDVDHVFTLDGTAISEGVSQLTAELDDLDVTLNPFTSYSVVYVGIGSEASPVLVGGVPSGPLLAYAQGAWVEADARLHVDEIALRAFVEEQQGEPYASGTITIAVVAEYNDGAGVTENSYKLYTLFGGVIGPGIPGIWPVESITSTASDVWINMEDGFYPVQLTTMYTLGGRFASYSDVSANPDTSYTITAQNAAGASVVVENASQGAWVEVDGATGAHLRVTTALRQLTGIEYNNSISLTITISYKGFTRNVYILAGQPA